MKCLLLFYAVYCVRCVSPYGAQYGAYEPYRRMILEDDKLCSEFTKRKIELHRSRYRALSVTATTSREHRFDWTSNKHCVFKVSFDDDDDNGVMAVIQRLDFRTDESGDCIDYVQFQTKHEQSRRFCGRWSVADSVHPDSGQQLVPLDYSFFTLHSKVETTVHIAKERLRDGQETHLEIVYTLFSACRPGLVECVRGQRTFCVDAPYQLDGIVNCGFEGCADEAGCASTVHADHSPRPGPGSGPGPVRLELGVMAVVIFAVFVTFCVSVYVLKKTRCLCWAGRFSLLQPPAGRSPAHEADEPQAGGAAPRATAPPLTETPPDVDPPPAYSDLFPTAK